MSLFLSSLKLLMLATFADRSVVWRPVKVIYHAIPATLGLGSVLADSTIGSLRFHFIVIGEKIGRVSFPK